MRSSEIFRGTLYAFLGALLGTVLAFLTARYLARPAIERRVARHPSFSRLDQAMGEQGRKIVFLLRLSPVIPFNLLNYALGVTRVRLADNVVASVGMLPGTLLYVYYGKVAGEVAALAGGSGVERGAEYYVVLALGLVATVAVTVVVTRMARRALNGETLRWRLLSEMHRPLLPFPRCSPWTSTTGGSWRTPIHATGRTRSRRTTTTWW